MSEEITPALTASEWAAKEATDEMGCAGYLLPDFPGQVFMADGEINGFRRRHALAALCLYGQPFGFTREDVEHLRLVAGQAEALRLGANHVHLLNALAARIAALLPPDGA